MYRYNCELCDFLARRPTNARMGGCRHHPEQTFTEGPAEEYCVCGAHGPVSPYGTTGRYQCGQCPGTASPPSPMTLPDDPIMRAIRQQDDLRELSRQQDAEY